MDLTRHDYGSLRLLKNVLLIVDFLFVGLMLLLVLLQNGWDIESIESGYMLIEDDMDSV